MRSIVSILILTAFAAAVPTFAQNSRVAHSKPADSFLSGPPFTLDQVLKVIAQDAIPIKRRKEAIQDRGVDFSMTPEAVARLKAAGTAEDVLDLIKSKARPLPPPPEPPKPPAVGGLRVSCAPAECDVSLNGNLRAATAGGVAELYGLEPGAYTVDLKHAGYISHQASVEVEADKTAGMSVTLKPTRETEERLGAELYQKMLQALGGETNLTPFGSLQATGSATTLISDGRTIRWAMRMRTRTNHALFQVKTGSIEHEVLFIGNDITASKSLKGQEALELPAAFGFVRDNQLAALLARLNSKHYKMIPVQADPGADSEFALTGESDTDKISIGLDPDSRPRRIKITTETGLGSVLITYADYILVGQAWYPKSIVVKPDGQQHGIEVHFDRVEIDTTAKDTDFKLRNKLFANFYN
jgi:PEGA domain